MIEDRSSQTDWRYPRNAATQYYPREFNEKEKEEHLKTSELANFVATSIPRLINWDVITVFDLLVLENFPVNIYLQLS